MILTFFFFLSQQNYVSHTSCISEQEKYNSGGIKNVLHKGIARQENWILSVHSKLRNFHPPPGVPNLMTKKLLESTNVPRTRAKFEVFYCRLHFQNFLSASFRFAKKCDIDALWQWITKEDKVENNFGCVKDSDSIEFLESSQTKEMASYDNGGDPKTFNSVIAANGEFDVKRILSIEIIVR